MNKHTTCLHKCSYKQCSSTTILTLVDRSDHYLCYQHYNAYKNAPENLYDGMIAYYEASHFISIMDKITRPEDHETNPKLPSHCIYDSCTQEKYIGCFPNVKVSEDFKLCKEHWDEFRNDKLCHYNCIWYYNQSKLFCKYLDIITQKPTDKITLPHHNIDKLTAQHKEYIDIQVGIIGHDFIVAIDNKLNSADANITEVEHLLEMKSIRSLSHVNTCRYVALYLLKHYQNQGWSNKHILFKTGEFVDTFYLRWSYVPCDEEITNINRVINAHKWTEIV